ncbi:aminopeptidase P family N-terminal domain-containing protein, partial [Ruminococcaceae bacterium OttesenSCG-928-N02]|nr:aminopeptidase P family N-terminal domain-containing protein [Ruminococcaceae bacterium OttesenSCG-928-N02]
MQERIEKVVKELPQNFGAALVSAPENRFYLLGVSSSAGNLLLFPDAAYFIIDFRYIELARANVTGAEVVLQENTEAQIAAL